MLREESRIKKRERDRKRYAKRRAYMKEYLKKYYLKNIDTIRKRSKRWAEKNRDKTVEYKKKWRLSNPNYKTNYFRTNLQGKLANQIRGYIRRALKYKKFTKDQTSKELLGITIPEFKIYLEKKFKHGMSWNNHGTFGWHIDHIIPLVNFDLTKKEERSMAFHYTNMQPLWAKENLIKNRYIINANSM
jgi:hypothetical protein